MDVMKVLADHGLVGSGGPYYRISARYAHGDLGGGGGVLTSFLEMTDDGGFITADSHITGKRMRRCDNNMRTIYTVVVGAYSDTTALALNRTEDAIYLVSSFNSSAVLAKRRVSDGGEVWSKTITRSLTSICVNPTGVYVLDASQNQVSKYTLTDGTLVWTKALPGKVNHIQVSDAGEVFAMGNLTVPMYRINLDGTVSNLAENGRYKPSRFWIFPGVNLIFCEYILAAAYYGLNGQGPTELIAESSDLGRFTNNSVYPLSFALGKTRLFVVANSGDVLVFSRNDYSLIDKVPCNAGRVAATPNSNDFVVGAANAMYAKYRK